MAQHAGICALLEFVGAVRQNGTMMKYVDLFAGCGGLSLGIERAGGELVTAVEKSDMAARTFFHNFIDDASDSAAWDRYVASSLRTQIERGVVVKELSALLEDDKLMESLEARNLDLVVGGPPCQGFSLAGRRDSEDIRNKLPWEYLDFVSRTSPKAVVIENVVGMNQKFGSQEQSSFDQLRIALSQTEPGYTVQAVLVNALHYGAPQHRPRLMILGIRSDIAMDHGIKATEHLWKSDFVDNLQSQIPDLAPQPTATTTNARTVAQAISDLSPHATEIQRSANEEYKHELSREEWGVRSHGYKNILNHVPRNHSARTQQRFRLYQYLAANGLEQRIVSRAAMLPDSEAALYVKTQLVDAVVPAMAPDGTELASTVEELHDLVHDLATKKHSQKVLGWSQPARTVVTLPDDYVHPVEPRIFTVREMARFQGFPEAFEFLGKETTGAHRRRVEVPQYSQVGNAVSPWLSWAVGQRLATLLGERHYEGTE